jgi:hypothetical protein
VPGTLDTGLEQEAVIMDPLTILGLLQSLRGGSGKKGVLGMIGIKNLLALIGLLVVGFATAGWYLGWYNINAQDDANGHHLKIQVNSSQITEDLNKGKDKVIMILEKEKGLVTQPSAQNVPSQPLSIPPEPRSPGEMHMPQAPAVPQPLPPPLPVPPPPAPQLRPPTLPPQPPQPTQEVDSWIYPR